MFDLSYDYVGDTADTISLIWNSDKNTSSNENICEIIEKLNDENTNLEKYVHFLDNNDLDNDGLLLNYF